MVPATRIAAEAGALEPALERALALGSDGVAQALEAHGLVAWDREQVIGGAQRALATLRAQRLPPREGPPLLITERRLQPLESLPAVWRALRSGRQVSLRVEPDGCNAVPRFLGFLSEALRERLGTSVLRIAGHGPLHEDAKPGGVTVAKTRIGLVQADADPELAAYVLTQACVRRCGVRPRSVHWVVVATTDARPYATLERHLRRLWLSVRMGEVHDETVFAGPVDDETAQAFDRANGWLADMGATALVEGGRLLSDDATFLGPSLFRVGRDDEAQTAGAQRMDELRGPLLVLDYQPRDRAEARLAELTGGALARGAVRIGVTPRGWTAPPKHVQYSGAVLVERLAPGLPSPRP